MPADMVCLGHTSLRMVVSHKEASSVDPTYTDAPDDLEARLSENKLAGSLVLYQGHYSMPETETSPDML